MCILLVCIVHLRFKIWRNTRIFCVHGCVELFRRQELGPNLGRCYLKEVLNWRWLPNVSLPVDEVYYECSPPPNSYRKKYTNSVKELSQDKR